MGISERKIAPLIKDRLSQIISDAEGAGIKFVELRQVKQNPIGMQFIGVEEVVVKESSNGTGYGIKVERISDGVLQFYADGRNVCWGYLPVTPKNIRFMAETLSLGKFTIMDSLVKKSVEEYATQNGWPIVPQRERGLDAFLKNKDVSLRIKSEELETENKTLADKVKALEEQLKKANERKPAYSGVSNLRGKGSKIKLGKIKTEADVEEVEEKEEVEV